MEKVIHRQELWALKGLLREKQMTYQIFGKKMGVGTNTLCNKLNGNTPLNTREITRMMEILEIEHEHMVRYFFPHLMQS